MKKIKRIGAMICVIALCFCMSAPSSHAVGLLGGQQFGAMMAAGLYATSILLNSLNIGVPGHFNEVCQWVNTPAKVEEGTFFDYNWPEPSESLSEYLNRSIIKVNQGVTTIDGVEYDELWISHEGAQKVKANAFDFKTKWNILSNNVGTLATGAGYIAGIPVYRIGGDIKSQQFISPVPGTYQEGEITVITNRDSYTRFKAYLDDSLVVEAYKVYGAAQTWTWDVFANTNSQGGWNTGMHVDGGMRVPSLPYDNNEFEFDYVSGIVPATEADIPDDYGISMKIPHEKLETFYNTYPQYDAEQATINIEQDQVDIDELTQAIFGMIDSLDEIKAEWTNGEEPEPPAPVDPIENIDQNVEDISQYQAEMQQQVDHMHQDVEAIHQTQQAQQQTQQEISETTDSIDSTLKEVKEAVKPGELTPRKFELRRLFPFCIPFDIYNFLQKFDAEPQAPHVQLPFVIESIGFEYMIDLDFSAFDGLAQTLRTLELIVYCLGLAWATSKVIKW